MKLFFIFAIILKVVQEYERAVMFRLGRILPGGARGPGKPHILLLFGNYKWFNYAQK